MRQDINNGLWNLISSKINDNFKELYDAAFQEVAIFNSEASRDAHYAADPTTLITGSKIIVTINNQLVFQSWGDGNNPNTYDPSFWVESGTLTLSKEQIKALYESNDDTECFTTIMKIILDSLSIDENGNIVSSKSWIFPPNTISIGENAALSNAIRALNLYDPILDRRGLLISQIYDDNGSKKAFIYDINAISTIVANEQVGDIADTASFERIPSHDELIRKFKIKTIDNNTEKSISINIKLNSFNGTDVYNVQEVITTDSSGYANVFLKNPILVDSGTKIFITFEIEGMEGITLEGVFVPKHSADVQWVQRKDIATEDFVRNEFNSLPWGAGYFVNKVSTYCQDSNTWYKVDATFTPTKEQNFTFDVVNKRWVYSNGIHSASIVASWTGGHDDDSTRVVSWEFRKNGQQLEYAPKTARIEKDDTMSMSLLIPYVELNTGDYIELYARVDDSSNDKVETENFNIMIR